MAVLLKFAVLLAVFMLVDHCKSESLMVGNATGQLAYVDNVKLSAIPFKIRTKNVFYNGNVPIKGISVLEKSSTKARASLTSGGVSFTSVNIKLKSERGDGLNYQIQIFV